MLLYNIPAFANEISLPVLERLALNNKKIVGVKDSSGDLTRLMHCMNRIKAKRPDFSTLVGWEGIFIPAMLMGADGGALSSAGVVPEIYVKMMKAFNEGNFTESKEIQLCVLDLFQTMLEATNFPEGFREGYAIRGFNPGRARMRLSASEETAMGGVRLEIAKILSDFGYSNAKSIYRKYQEKTCQLVL